MRLAGDQGIVARARIDRQVFDDEQIGFDEGVGANRTVQRRFTRFETDLRLEPLAVFRDEAHEGDRRLADLRREMHDVVKTGLGRRVENVEAPKRRKPFCVKRVVGWLHAGLWLVGSARRGVQNMAVALLELRAGASADIGSALL